MKKRGCLILLIISAVVCVLLWYAGEVLFSRPARVARARIEAADYTAVLKACRRMMATVATYADESTAPADLCDPGSVSIHSGSEQFEHRVPKPIADLHPVWLVVKTNECLLIVRGPPCRVSIHAFGPGTEGHGLKQLTNGLWMN
jgi:hypothetical protein